MIKITIADQTKPIQEASPEWIRSTINKNRVMGKQNCVKIDIDSENANLQLTTNCGETANAKPSNDIESRLTFLWDDLVLSKDDLDPAALYDFLKRMDQWISFVPK
ncbi:MAG: hypothetical protein U5K69_12595 [Balneolaceae bacterium]|nr:hypothetical protein [Balneolaceae bacterium]